MSSQFGGPLKNTSHWCFLKPSSWWPLHQVGVKEGHGQRHWHICNGSSPLDITRLVAGPHLGASQRTPILAQCLVYSRHWASIYDWLTNRLQVRFLLSGPTLPPLRSLRVFTQWQKLTQIVNYLSLGHQIIFGNITAWLVACPWYPRFLRGDVN